MKEAIKRLRECKSGESSNEGLHKRARSMERALERMEKLKETYFRTKTNGTSV